MNEPILFITGAGASVDSGLKTYRGEGGLYEGSERSPAEDLSIGTWRVHPEKTWKTLRSLIKKSKGCKPGPTYQILKKVAKEKDIQIWTQNVDGLSLTVGCPVWELHGNIRTMRCEKCVKEVPLDEDNPKCECGRLCKPDIVLYGENIKEKTGSLMYFNTVIVIGTTLQFPYLLNMIEYQESHGAKVIHINPDPNYQAPKRHEFLCMKSEDGLNELF